MKIVPFIVCFAAMALTGCGERGSQGRLGEMAVELKRNSGRIQELSLALDGINTRLASIEQSVQKLAHASGRPEKSLPASPSAPPGGSTNLESISKQVATLAAELAATKQQLVSTREALENMQRKLLRPKELGKAIHGLLGNPEEFAKGLDRLLENVSPRIEDTAARQNFEAEILELRDHVLAGSSPEELYQELLSRHVEKLNLVTDERDRQAIRQAISNLENCSEQELQERLANYARERTLDRFFRIVKSYGLQEDELLRSFPVLPRKK